MKKIFSAILTVSMLFFAAPSAFADEELANSMAPGTWTENARCLTFGEYNGHALKWRVLEADGETAFLVLEDVLREEDGIVDGISFDDDWKGIGNNFPGSEIFAFLNDTFLSSLAEYQAGILTTTYGPDNDGRTWKGGPSEASSQVFLLSVGEAMNPDYFKDDADRAVYESYWLRSPGDGSDITAAVWSDGSVSADGTGILGVRLAIRPALKIDISSPVFTSALVSEPTPKPDTSYNDTGSPDS